ncbi:MAG: sortase [Anaerolineae bacterium]|jgi:LPXTG-site transpeptidase (sortase) family protein|nr:sortase [Anaerolineae bacterium]
MYKRQRGPNGIILLIIGVIAGVIFVFYDQTRVSPPDPIHTPESTFTPIPITLERPSLTTTPMSGIVSNATLLIPAAGVTAPIIPVYLDGETWDVGQLGNNIGHLEGTPWLDQPGNIVLSGHVELSNGRRGVFASLRDLVIGDQVILIYEGRETYYQVRESYLVEPEDLTPLYPTERDQLTLITCEGYDFIQDLYQSRLVVIAERIN